MARTLKQGLDYFPLNVNLDDKVELIEAKFGLVGFAVLIKLWQKIYSNSYYILWTEERKLIFKKQININLELLDEIVKDCLNWGLFDKTMFKKYKILTSKGIQSRYCEITQRRKEVEILEAYSLLNNVQKLTKINNVNINDKNVNKNKLNTDINSQIKENKIKENKIKEKEKNTHACAREELSLSQIKFKNAFPNKNIDTDLDVNQNIDLLIKGINDSEFLRNCDNLSLSWFKSHYDEIIKGKFKDFKKEKQKVFKNERSYSQEECEQFFTDINNVQI